MKSYSDDIPNVTREELNEQREIQTRTLNEASRSANMLRDANDMLAAIVASQNVVLDELKRVKTRVTIAIVLGAIASVGAIAIGLRLYNSVL